MMTLAAVEQSQGQPPPEAPAVYEWKATSHPDGRCRHHWTLGVAGVLRCACCAVRYEVAREEEVPRG